MILDKKIIFHEDKRQELKGIIYQTN